MTETRRPTMTIEDLALYLQISPETIRSNCSKKPHAVPPFFKTGDSSNSNIRFRPEDVDHWVEEKIQAQNEKRKAAESTGIDWGI